MRELEECRIFMGAHPAVPDQIGKTKGHTESGTVGRSASYKRAGKW